MRGLVRRGQRLGLAFFATLLLSLSALIAGVGLWYASLTADLPSISQVEELLDPGTGAFLQPTRIYDRSGQNLLLAVENPGIPRRYLKIDPAASDHFSPELVRVAIALIDPSFWQNPGFLLSNLGSPQPVTIAERLALDLLLSQEPPGLQRALRMRILAAQLISQAGRPKVLEWYLNSAYFGRLSYGAESAARLYLDKSSSELTLAEVALIVPLAATPALNPLDSPVAALERQQAALDILFSQGTISADERSRAVGQELQLRKTAPENASLAPAFTSQVIADAAQRLGQQRLERGGLRITTTLDFDLQQQVGCLTATQLNRLQGRDIQVSLPEGGPCQAARLLPTLSDTALLPADLAMSAVILDPRSGQILALLGDRTLERETPALQTHEPGSLLTPFAAVAAFARGFGPATLMWDIPDVQEGEQIVRLTAEDYHGPVRLRLAIANDYLGPQIRLIDQLGAPNVWRLATSLGLEGLSLERSSQTVLTGGRLTPLEVAAGYSAFANLGSVYGQRLPGAGAVKPASILYIENNNGLVLYDGQTAESQSLLSASLAYMVHAVLSDESARWHSLGFPNPLEIGRPAGAKTGASVQGRDAWVAGYTPLRMVVVWIGLPGDAEARVDVRQAAAAWHALIQYTSRELPVADWQMPPGISRVTVCDPSGKLPTAECPALVSELFLNGNEPVSSDTLYQAVQVNRETGRLATVFTPPALVEDHVFMMVPPEARTWAESAGLALAPEVYDVIQPPAPSPDVHISSPSMFAYLRGKVSVRGSAAGSDLVSYRLQAGEGLNPKSWLQVGQESKQAIREGDLAEWDTSGLNGLYALRLVVVRSDNTVENAILQVTVDNLPPVPSLTYPTSGQEFSSAKDFQITFQANVEDGVGVRRLEWILDDKPLGENLVAPYSITWTSAPGEHTLRLRATDLAGNQAESIPVTFSVKP
jgi:membrane peptidoglycan carboxypeptidase